MCEQISVIWAFDIASKHVDQASFYRSESGARAAAAAWARQWWPTEVAWRDDAPMTQEAFDALPDSAAVDAYFDAVSHFESYQIYSDSVGD